MSFPLLRDRVGETGRVIGVELSPDMHRLAEEKIAQARWENVVSIEAALEDADIPSGLDAVLSEVRVRVEAGELEVRTMADFAAREPT